ncbi:MAG: alpha/beta hydrolase [Ferruginibacter sp.]
MLISCKKGDNTRFISSINVVKEEINIAYGNHARQKMDVYFPLGYNNSTPVVFLMHGGGYYEGTKEQFTDKAKMFCTEGFVVINFNYRLIDTTGLFYALPLHQLSAVKIADVLQDVDAAVNKYKSMASGWGVGSAKMYMAGHSAGAITSLLYLVNSLNDDGDIKAGGNWGGTTDFSQACDTSVFIGPYAPYALFYKELVYRWTGFEPVPANTLAYMAHSAYWITKTRGGKPTISIMPEVNDFFLRTSPLSTITNTINYHTLLNSFSIPNQYIEIKGENHGFEVLTDSWKNTVHKTSEFFKAH